MKILGIGNAIVDVICKVEDKYLSDNGLTKSTMKLVDEIDFKKLISTLKIEDTVSGGSVANSIVGLSKLGNKVGFIGKVSDDDLGQRYEDGLKKESVDYFYFKKKEALPTGTCLILITPDSERTMCTFLGTAGKIDENDVIDSLIKQSEVRRKIAEETREFKTKSEKLSENKFFKIEYEDGKKQLIINENHQLYKEINKEKSAEKIKKILELLFISFDQTIQLFDSEESIKVTDFEDMLIHNWSIILKNYLKKSYV